ncbi:MAG: hypothetical protein QW135_07450 [Ignisphaera sp.]
MYAKTCTLSLIVVLISLLATSVYSQSVSLEIDGNDNDWINWVNNSGELWVSPAGRGCYAPSVSRTVWLCCNQTSYPRICQIIWRDDINGSSDDIDTIRLYIDQTNIYIYTNITNPTTYTYRRFNISLGDNTISVRYLLWWWGTWHVSIRVYVNNVDRTISTSIGTRYSNNILGLELCIPRSLLTNLQGDIKFSGLTYVRTIRRPSVRDHVEVTVDSNTYTYVVLGVSSIGIEYGFIGSTDKPIPISEPGILVGLTVLLTLVFVIASLSSRYRF